MYIVETRERCLIFLFFFWMRRDTRDDLTVCDRILV
jgi:hypothetical protein